MSDNVDLCTEEGKLKMTLKLPASQEVRDVAFHFIVRKIIVLSRLMDSCKTKCSYFLHCYSETGKLENSTFLCKKERISIYDIALTSHPSGLVAVVERESITYI